MTAFNRTTLRLWFASVLVPFTMMVICKDWERSKSKLLKGKITGQTLLHRFVFCLQVIEFKIHLHRVYQKRNSCLIKSYPCINVFSFRIFSSLITGRVHCQFGRNFQMFKHIKQLDLVFSAVSVCIFCSYHNSAPNVYH